MPDQHPLLSNPINDIERAVVRLTARCNELVNLANDLRTEVVAANRRASEANRKLDAELMANNELRSQLNAERNLHRSPQ